MKLESLSLDKFKKDELQNAKSIFGGIQGKDEPWETGCSDAPDCCTGGDECGDSYPMEMKVKIDPNYDPKLDPKFNPDFKP